MFSGWSKPMALKIIRIVSKCNISLIVIIKNYTQFTKKTKNKKIKREVDV